MSGDIDPYSEFNIYRTTREFVDKLTILQKARERGKRSAYGEKPERKIRDLTNQLFAYLRMTLSPIPQGYITDRGRVNQIMVERYFNGRIPPYTAQVLLESIRPHLALESAPQGVRIEVSHPYNRYIRTLQSYPLPDGIMDENIEWILQYVYPWEPVRGSHSEMRLLEVEFLKILSGLPSISSNLLERLCSHEDADIRTSASRNNNCPEDGKIIVALLNNRILETGGL
jgi:hypothetical protein